MRGCSVPVVVATLLFLLVPLANSESYLCVGENGASVKEGGDNFDVELIDFSDFKYILYKNKGKWSMKKFGINMEFLDYCPVPKTGGPPYSCQSSDHDKYKGIFFREDDNTFILISMIANYNAKDVQHFVMKGKCSKI